MPRVRAPKLPEHCSWLNTSRPLSLQELRGRIVILDFWTYGCINCLHVLPDLAYLEHKYREHLIVIGVHSAKFANEQASEQVHQAALRYDIKHPVLLDRDFEVWQQYAVRAWPTLTVIDAEGYVVGQFAGEGNRDRLDHLIGELIQQPRSPESILLHPLNLADSVLFQTHEPFITPLAFPGKVLAVGDRLFVADSGHHRLVISNLTGEVLHIIGTGEPGLKDGSFTQAQFFRPQGMTFDPQAEVLYVADTGNHALRRLDLQRQTVETIAGTGEQSRYLYPHGGLALEVSLNSPWDLVKVGSSLFVAIAGAHQIWQMQLGTNTIETYAGTGAEGCVDGEVTQAAFAQPSGLATDGKFLYVADSETSSIRAINLKEPPQVQTICGSGALFDFGDVDAFGMQARLQHCLGVTYAEENLWIADTYNHKIKRVNLQTGYCQTVVITNPSTQQNTKEQGDRLSEPSGLSVLGKNLYIADTNNHAIRRLDLASLTLTTLNFVGLCAPNGCLPPQDL